MIKFDEADYRKNLTNQIALIEKGAAYAEEIR